MSLVIGGNAEVFSALGYPVPETIKKHLYKLKAESSVFRGNIDHVEMVYPSALGQFSLDAVFGQGLWQLDSGGEYMKRIVLTLCDRFRHAVVLDFLLRIWPLVKEQLYDRFFESASCDESAEEVMETRQITLRTVFNKILQRVSNLSDVESIFERALGWYLSVGLVPIISFNDVDRPNSSFDYFDLINSVFNRIKVPSPLPGFNKTMILRNLNTSEFEVFDAETGEFGEWGLFFGQEAMPTFLPVRDLVLCDLGFFFARNKAAEMAIQKMSVDLVATTSGKLSAEESKKLHEKEIKEALKIKQTKDLDKYRSEIKNTVSNVAGAEMADEMVSLLVRSRDSMRRTDMDIAAERAEDSQYNSELQLKMAATVSAEESVKRISEIRRLISEEEEIGPTMADRAISGLAEMPLAQTVKKHSVQVATLQREKKNLRSQLLSTEAKVSKLTEMHKAAALESLRIKKDYLQKAQEASEYRMEVNQNRKALASGQKEMKRMAEYSKKLLNTLEGLIKHCSLREDQVTYLKNTLKTVAETAAEVQQDAKLAHLSRKPGKNLAPSTITTDPVKGSSWYVSNLGSFFKSENTLLTYADVLDLFKVRVVPINPLVCDKIEFDRKSRYVADTRLKDLLIVPPVDSMARRYTLDNVQVAESESLKVICVDLGGPADRAGFFSVKNAKEDALDSVDKHRKRQWAGTVTNLLKTNKRTKVTETGQIVTQEITPQTYHNFIHKFFTQMVGPFYNWPAVLEMLLTLDDTSLVAGKNKTVVDTFVNFILQQ